MALVNCRECGKEVNSKLKKCIHCGTKNPDPKKHAQMQKVMKGWGALAAAFVILAAIAPDEPKQPKRPPSAAELHQKRIESGFSGWDGAHKGLERLVKDAMNDPSSYEHIETRYRENTDGKTLTVTIRFRGRNAFGGMIANSVTASTDIETGKVLEIIAQE